MSEFIVRNIRRTINEGGGLIVTTTHRDEDDVKTAPTNLWYRIDDLTNDRVVLDWTAISTPAISNTFTITGTQNDLEDNLEEYEVRQLTTYTLDASGTPNAQDFHYQVNRIFEKTTVEYPTA